MRDYSIISPKFWTGTTGRSLRQHPDAQRVAFYLLTSPNANMIGLYYLPLPTLCHEVGITLEGASKALRSLSEGGFAHHDPASEVVWVPEMARFQVGETLSPRDNRHKAVLRELEAQRKCKFYADFHAKYARPFCLPAASPFEAPSKPLRSQDQEQEQEQEQETPPNPPQAGGVLEKAESGKRSSGRVDPVDAVPIPCVLETPAFRVAWAEWRKYRIEVKERLTASSAEKQLKKLAAMGERRAIACIDHTIEKSWKGLREPEGDEAPALTQAAPQCRAPSKFEMDHGSYNPQTGFALDANGKIITDQHCADLACAHCAPRRKGVA